MGSRDPWTDHEKNVWARESRTTSWLDMGSAAVRTVIGHLEAGRGPAAATGRERWGRRGPPAARLNRERCAPLHHTRTPTYAHVRTPRPGAPVPLERCSIPPHSGRAAGRRRGRVDRIVKVRFDPDRRYPMPRIVRGALVQATWTGDKESMIQKHEARAHEAKAQGAQFVMFQELFYGPYFCQVQDPQYYSYTELIPDGPTTRRMQDLAKQTGMILVVPMYEEDSQASGVYYNTAAVIDADGRYLGKYRKTHIPHVKGFWEKFYFRPGNLGYPVFETAVGKIGVYICYDRHFPEGARALGLNGAEIVLIPSATSRGLSEYLWRIEQPSHAVANGYYVGTINRVGIEAAIGDDDFYGQSYFCDPRGQIVGGVASPYEEELVVRDLDLDVITEVRQTWQFYRDRRPEAYGDLVRP